MKRFLPILIIALATLIIVPIIVYADGPAITKCTIIVDQEDYPIVGVALHLEETTNGVVSDSDGRVCLTGAPDAVVVITHLGYQSERIQLKDLPAKVYLIEDVD